VVGLGEPRVQVAVVLVGLRALDAVAAERDEPGVLVAVVVVELPAPRAELVARAGPRALDAVVAEQGEPRVLVAVVPVELAGPRAGAVAQAEFPVPAVADSAVHSVGHSFVLGAAIAVLGAQAGERGEPRAPAARQEPPLDLVRAQWALEPAGAELPRAQAVAAV
jgi:hypothetical protein